MCLRLSIRLSFSQLKASLKPEHNLKTAMLYGPGGAGKTMMVEAIASEVYIVGGVTGWEVFARKFHVHISALEMRHTCRLENLKKWKQRFRCRIESNPIELFGVQLLTPDN